MTPISSLTRVCLSPALRPEGRSAGASEAVERGIPVVGSDRVRIPGALGDFAIVLPLPERITAATRTLPMAEEVAPWVEAVIRLWDDAGFDEDVRRRAVAEAARRASDHPKSASVLAGPATPPDRSRSTVLVPHLNGIDWECEQPLRKLEEAGVKVVRSGGSSSIDVARNRLASGAIHDGAESIFFIDADIGFDPRDALRLLDRPEAVVSGVYAKKGRRELASIFADGIEEVVFGPKAPGLYPLKYAATGFLRIKAAVLRRMVEALKLPLCNRKWGRGEWPFFLPEVVPQGDGEFHYLGEDWAFSHRLALIGVTPMADTSIRLWHYGRHPFGWEDAGADGKRFASYTYRLGGR